MLIPLLTFATTVALVVGAYWWFVAAPEDREHAALQKRLRAEKSNIEIKVLLTKEEAALSEITALNRLLVNFESHFASLTTLLDASGLKLSLGKFLLLSGTGFMAGAFAAQQYLGVWWITLLTALSGGFLPLVVVRMIRARRLHKFEEQFPEAVDLISRALRAGHAFATGLKIAAEEMPSPVGPEFKLLFERQNYGGQLNDALKSFAERIPLLDARFFVTAVLTQRETGGNLSEVLDRLASVMRERFKIKREVRVKSAHGRMTAYVLAAMPPVLALLLMLLNPEQMQLLATNPLGQRMLMVASGLQVVGVLLVRKIVDIRY
ncbi:MAG: type II secretion system F family protein [Vicinamibacterales bacterium]